MNKLLCLAAFAASCASATTAAQTLTGADVSAAVYCCTAPAEATRISTIGTAVVGPAVEFPAGSLLPTSGFFPLIPVAIDIGATTITLQYSTATSARDAVFNGHMIRFDGAPEIVGVAIDPSSTYRPFEVTFRSDAILINAAGVVFTPDSRLVLDVMLAVPEPAGAALLLAGLAVLAVLARSKREAGAAARGLFA